MDRRKESKETLQDPRCIKPSALRDSRLEHTFLVPFLRYLPQPSN